MAKSDGIPIAGRDNDNDNPFYDQTAFSPPQIHHMLDQLRAGKGVGTKHADLVEGRERSASQPPPINLRSASAHSFYFAFFFLFTRDLLGATWYSCIRRSYGSLN